MKTLPKRTVVIVGGGVASGLVARQLVAKGIEVLVLEQGGDHRNSAAGKIPTQRDELRWDLHMGLAQDPAVQTYSLRHSITEDALPLRRLGLFMPGSGVGGAGNHWNGQVWRWSEYDTVLRSRFEQRYGKHAIPDEMPLQDWGLTYAELEPHYDLFEKLFGVSGKAGNLRGQLQPGGNPFEAPRQNEYPQAPLEITEGGIIFKETTEKMGYQPFQSPGANSTGAYTNPDGMKLAPCQYCGHCDRFICEANAKGTPEVLLYPWLMRQPHFELRTFCHVLRVDYDRTGKRVRGVRYIDLTSGEEYFQPAEVVVLGAFTLSNTKFLLLEGIGKPYDPKTRTGVVGKNFCYQTSSGVNLFFKDRWINPFMSAGSSVTIIDEFNGDNFDHTHLDFLGGGFVASAVSGRPIVSRRLPAGTPRWGSEWKQASADWYAHSFSIGFQGSCYPHRENYLDLDPVYTDGYGQPLVRMTFDIRENERRVSEFGTNKAAEIARATGATLVGSVVPKKPPFDGRVYQSTHVTGGTIMGRDPGTSVVSPRLQHWDAENLFVIGASVYPHNSGYNPTGPLAALALRLGDDLVRYVSRPEYL